MNGTSGEYEGRIVGSWRLDSLLGVRGKTAFYLTKSKGQEDDRLVQLMLADAESAAVLASWNRARQLPGEQFVRVHETGKADLDGTSVAYAVMDLPDDDLSEILSRRTLDETEAREIFSAVAGALYVLHQRGLAHCAVTPSNIFVVRDATRLSVDTLAPGGTRAREQDLLQFGATMVKALTGCADEDLSGAPAISHAAAHLPQPFKQIAVGCVGGSSGGKWTAARVVETLTGRAPEKASRPRFPWLALAGAGIGIVVLLFYLFFHGTRGLQPKAQVMQPIPVPAQVQTQAPVETQAPARTEEPVRTEASAVRPPATAGVADRNTTERRVGPSWAVIATAYARFESAQKRADAYHRRFPQLRPHVFPPEGQGKHYLVVLGSGLTKDAAERLRRDAVEQGAPPDTYVTKIAEN